ncbi:hypothetical protein F4604DRAFT_1677616 [Suillus subluteus]|nr:hypothetical protein F4604DRAFT_1677616 [Suillus subluteus]
MTVVSNDPSWWPVINASVISSYFTVATSVGLVYDWALTFGQEVELIWVRYVGIGYAVMYILVSVPTISMTDTGCLIISDGFDGMSDVVNVILGEEYVLSGTYQCMFDSGGDSAFLGSMTWILDTVWEVVALCLAVWIAVKHFRELRQHSTRGFIGDCFTVLMKTHLGMFSPTLSANSYSLGAQIYEGFAQIFEIMGMFVLGPRLILGVREYHAELVANSDTATAMTSIAFQERVHVSTSSRTMQSWGSLES